MNDTIATDEPINPYEPECVAALMALSKFSELIASASNDEGYRTIVATALRKAMEYGVTVSMDGDASEAEKQNLAQIRTWLASLATQYNAHKERGGVH